MPGMSQPELCPRQTVPRSIQDLVGRLVTTKGNNTTKIVNMLKETGPLHIKLAEVVLLIRSYNSTDVCIIER